MLDNNNENANSQNGETLGNDQEKNIEENLELENDEVFDEEEYDDNEEEEIEDEELKAKFSALKNSNKRLFERAKKAEGKLKKIKEEKLGDTPSQSSTKQVSGRNGDISITTVLDLQSKGFTPLEIKELNEEASSMGLSVEALVSNEKYMAGIEAIRAKQKVEQATPRPTNSNPIKLQNGKTYKEVVTNRESSIDEKQKAFEEMKKKFVHK